MQDLTRSVEATKRLTLAWQNAAMGRKKHNWAPSLGTREADGTLTSRCKHCLLEHRESWHEQDGQVLHVDQWWTPGGQLFRIRPGLWLEPPASAPPLEGAFPGVEIGGVPECPKTAEAWTA